MLDVPAAFDLFLAPFARFLPAFDRFGGALGRVGALSGQFGVAFDRTGVVFELIGAPFVVVGVALARFAIRVSELTSLARASAMYRRLRRADDSLFQRTAGCRCALT